MIMRFEIEIWVKTPTGIKIKSKQYKNGLTASIGAFVSRLKYQNEKMVLNDLVKRTNTNI